MRVAALLVALLVLAGSAVGSYALVTAEPSLPAIAEPSTVRIDQPRSQRPLSLDVGTR